MPWDADKSTAADPDNPAPDEQLTADEWDAHVTEGHFPSDELNFGVDAGGDPVITDPQNGGETVMRYDRAAGSWVIDSLNTNEATLSSELDHPITPPQGKTGSRSFGIDYQNTTGHPIIVSISLRIDSAGETMFAKIQIGDTTTSYNRDVEIAYRDGGLDGDRYQDTLQTIVEDGQYYKLTGFDDGDIVLWNEREYKK